MSSTILEGRYRLDNVIGEGGMATVWSGWDLRLDRPVAIKMVRPGGSLSEETKATFLREARMAAALNHRNVVAVHDAGVAGGQPYLVMERLPGPGLRQRLADGPLPTSEAIGITRQLASALEALHARDLLHLDIKPENILFGEGGVPKLTDFGLSRSLSQDHSAPEHGMVMATPGYVAPEAITGAPLDGRSDVYALGIVLYEMLTGRRPFEGDTAAAQAAQRLVADPVPPHSLNPAVPPQLGQVVLRALARDPAARYASPSALAEALQRYQARAQQHTTAVPVQSGYRHAQGARPEAPRRERMPSGGARPYAASDGRRREEGSAPWSWLGALLFVFLLCGGIAALAWLGLPYVRAEIPPLPTADAGIVPVELADDEPAVILPTEPPTEELIVVDFPTFTPEPPTQEPVVVATPEPVVAATQEPVVVVTQEPPTPEPTEAIITTMTPAAIRLEDTDWRGGYRRDAPQTIYGGRTATWIYGTSTQFDTMQAAWELPAQPVGTATLSVEGMDSEDRGKTTISVSVNGVEIYQGPNPLPDDDIPFETGTWATYTWPFDAALLQPGRNTITIRNLEPGAFSLPPFFMLDYAIVEVEIPSPN